MMTQNVIPTHCLCRNLDEVRRSLGATTPSAQTCITLPAKRARTLPHCGNLRRIQAFLRNRQKSFNSKIIAFHIISAC
jgi:hypothetical protein